MPHFGARSRANLETCNEKLQKLFNEVIKNYDCSVIEGHRSNERQQELLDQGLTEKGPGDSLHNIRPSLAADVIPYPARLNGKLVWDNPQRFCVFAGFVLQTALHLGIYIRWGGDWDMDGDPTNNWQDMAHFELRKET